MNVQTENVEVAGASLMIEGLVIADPFGGRYEDLAAVHAAERRAI